MLLACLGRGACRPALAERCDTGGRAFNIGNAHPITILDLAKRVIARAESSSSIRFVPYEEAYDDGFEELGRRRPDHAVAV